ncbi:MAG: hypothetical protein LBD21_07945, partial [Tannerellaceae bacterium]|nr:hypothetical protein [Tannerellaceae bacterium]
HNEIVVMSCNCHFKRTFNVTIADHDFFIFLPDAFIDSCVGKMYGLEGARMASGFPIEPDFWVGVHRLESLKMLRYATMPLNMLLENRTGCGKSHPFQMTLAC